MIKMRVLMNNDLFYKTTVAFSLRVNYFTFCLNREEKKKNIYQQMRWRKTPVRKPIWLPPAKNKLFYIPKHPESPKDEHDELKRLFCNYRTNMKALSNYFKIECEELSATGHLTVAKAKLEEQEFDKLLELNDTENERVATLREARVAKELEAEHQNLLNLNEQHAKWLLRKKIEIETLVQQEKELSKSFITLENLDSAIEKCLSDVVNYNFAIDLEGQVLWESTPHPTFSPYREKRDLNEKLLR